MVCERAGCSDGFAVLSGGGTAGRGQSGAGGSAGSAGVLSLADSGGLADRVALAHTRDDQAETVLFRVLRGSGLTGLAGIHPVTGDGLIRPLIGVTRGEVLEFLRVRSIAWRED